MQVNLLGWMKVHPLYMTIGNIHKQICRGYSQNAYKVLTYFLVLEATKLNNKRGIQGCKKDSISYVYVQMSESTLGIWEMVW